MKFFVEELKCKTGQEWKKECKESKKGDKQ